MIATYTLAEVAEKFGKSEATAAKYCARRQWPHHRDGRFIFFTDEDVEQIVAAAAVLVDPLETNRLPGQTRLSALRNGRR